MKEINALGKACPMPVIEAKKALGTEEGRDGIVISVDNEIATQNLAKLAEQMELSYSVSKQSEQEYRVAIGGEGQVPESVKSRLETGTGYVVAISSLEMGSGDSKLGKKLMGSLLYALSEQDELPKAVLFYNAGVYLTVEESDSLEDLKALEAAGVEILSCGLCLDFYHVTEKLAVGSVSNMYRIVEMMRSHATVRP